MAKAKPKSSAAAFRRLEAELADLCRYEPQTTGVAPAKAEARAATVEAQIKEICDLASSGEPGFSKRFMLRLRSRWRSSQNFIDYVHERNGLLVRLGEVSAEKHKRVLGESRRLHAVFIVSRDRQMAEEFLRKRNTSQSDSALKAEIGERRDLGRSASIKAVNRGLKALKV
jgi:hypothetical protein